MIIAQDSIGRLEKMQPTRHPVGGNPRLATTSISSTGLGDAEAGGDGRIFSNVIAQGAEAVLVKNGNFVVKERLSKGYRLAEIDRSLRKTRTRREAKVLEKLSEIGVLSPRLEKMDDKKMQVTMSFIEGDKVRDVLGKENCVTLGTQIGKTLGRMHAAAIMHADLTTSNMIINEDGLHFIDFGLSFFSDKVEDRAVDLHLLYETIQGVHYDVLDLCWGAIITGYLSAYSEGGAVLKRYEEVALRGRNKNPKPTKESDV